METQSKVRPSVRVLVAIVSIPLWLGILYFAFAMFVGEPFEFGFTNLLMFALAALVISIVGFGKFPSFHSKPE